mmetsp:Transcript_5372/g.9199  ORF Transcript_5372/g.9199 Transcript_5372/m.9199 type:complete len:93 (-) Transcript_5372:916-1194(-)
MLLSLGNFLDRIYKDQYERSQQRNLPRVLFIFLLNIAMPVLTFEILQLKKSSFPRSIAFASPFGVMVLLMIVCSIFRHISFLLVIALEDTLH